MANKKIKKTKVNKYISSSLYLEFQSQSELDYHSFGILTNYDIEKILVEFLEDCYIKQLTNVLIITGKGIVVKPLVNKLLNKNKYVDSFKQAGYFNGQEGAFEITLVS